jgi:hypothetical protein
LPRLVGGFHGVWACSIVFQATSYCSPGPPRQWGGRCPGRFLERMLSEVFAWWRRLPSLSDEVNGLASPLHRPTTHSRLSRRQGFPMRRHLVLSWWWLVMFVGGGEASWGVVISWRFCPLRYMSMEYCIAKWVLTRRCLPPGKVMMLFRHVPQA